jgi:2-iminobutanoate/2-iminopropanoate deaminase
MPIQVIRGEGVPESHLPFSPAIKAGGFVFVSGQASVGENGQIVKDKFAGEFRRSMENVKKILAYDGLTLKDVVRVTSYLADAGDLSEYNKLYREFFEKPYPARTTLTNCLPQGLVKFEIDVVAYCGD